MNKANEANSKTMHQQALKQAYEVIVEGIRKISCELANRCTFKSEKEIISDIGGKIRALSRDMPTQMMQSGILPVLAFLLSKATYNIYNKVRKFFEKGILEVETFDISKIAHAIYLHLLEKWIKDKIPELRNIGDIGELINKMADDPRYIMKAQRFLHIIMFYAKELTEAYYESER